MPINTNPLSSSKPTHLHNSPWPTQASILPDQWQHTFWGNVTPQAHASMLQHCLRETTFGKTLRPPVAPNNDASLEQKVIFARHGIIAAVQSYDKNMLGTLIRWQVPKEQICAATHALDNPTIRQWLSESHKFKCPHSVDS